MDGDDNAGGLRQSAAVEKLRIGGVPIINVMPFAAVVRDGWGVEISRNVLDAVLLEQRAHHFPNAAITDHNRVALPAGRARHQRRVYRYVGSQPCANPPADERQ